MFGKGGGGSIDQHVQTDHVLMERDKMVCVSSLPAENKSSPHNTSRIKKLRMQLCEPPAKSGVTVKRMYEPARMSSLQNSTE
jgi:hypothetical protein